MVVQRDGCYELLMTQTSELYLFCKVDLIIIYRYKLYYILFQYIESITIKVI